MPVNTDWLEVRVILLYRSAVSLHVVLSCLWKETVTFLQNGVIGHLSQMSHLTSYHSLSSFRTFPLAFWCIIIVIRILIFFNLIGLHKSIYFVWVCAYEKHCSEDVIENTCRTHLKGGTISQLIIPSSKGVEQMKSFLASGGM